MGCYWWDVSEDAFKSSRAFFIGSIQESLRKYLRGFLSFGVFKWSFSIFKLSSWILKLILWIFLKIFSLFLADILKTSTIVSNIWQNYHGFWSNLTVIEGNLHIICNIWEFFNFQIEFLHFQIDFWPKRTKISPVFLYVSSSDYFL